MSSEKRKMLDISIAPQKVNQFRESLQDTCENCDARLYAECIAQDVSSFLTLQRSPMTVLFRLRERHHAEFQENT